MTGPLVRKGAKAAVDALEEARLARAAEQGFDVIGYHGRAGDLSVDHLRPSPGGMIGPGIYFAKDPKIASKFAEIRGKNNAIVEPDKAAFVLPTRSRGRFVSSERWQSMLDSGLSADEAIDALKKEGYTGVDAPGMFTIWDPKDVRSVHAEFRDSGSRNLLAGVTGATATGAVVAGGQPAEASDSSPRSGGFFADFATNELARADSIQGAANDIASGYGDLRRSAQAPEGSVRARLGNAIEGAGNRVTSALEGAQDRTRLAHPHVRGGIDALKFLTDGAGEFYGNVVRDPLGTDGAIAAGTAGVGAIMAAPAARTGVQKARDAAPEALRRLRDTVRPTAPAGIKDARAASRQRRRQAASQGGETPNYTPQRGVDDTNPLIAYMRTAFGDSTEIPSAATPTARQGPVNEAIANRLLGASTGDGKPIIDAAGASRADLLQRRAAQFARLMQPKNGTPPRPVAASTGRRLPLDVFENPIPIQVTRRNKKGVEREYTQYRLPDDVLSPADWGPGPRGAGGLVDADKVGRTAAEDFGSQVPRFIERGQMNARGRAADITARMAERDPARAVRFAEAFTRARPNIASKEVRNRLNTETAQFKKARDAVRATETGLARDVAGDIQRGSTAVALPLAALTLGALGGGAIESDMAERANRRDQQAMEIVGSQQDTVERLNPPGGDLGADSEWPVNSMRLLIDDPALVAAGEMWRANAFGNEDDSDRRMLMRERGMAALGGPKSREYGAVYRMLINNDPPRTSTELAELESGLEKLNAAYAQAGADADGPMGIPQQSPDAAEMALNIRPWTATGNPNNYEMSNLSGPAEWPEIPAPASLDGASTSERAGEITDNPLVENVDATTSNLQRQMADAGLYKGAIDGIEGDQHAAALAELGEIWGEDVSDPEIALDRASRTVSPDEGWDSVQAMLNAVGVDAGPEDGKPGPLTLRGLNEGRAKRGLPPLTDQQYRDVKDRPAAVLAELLDGRVR